MKIRLFLLALILGAGAPFLIPNVQAAPVDTVTVTATVLEQISYQEINGNIVVTTNRAQGATAQLDTRCFEGRDLKIKTTQSQPNTLFVFASF